MKRHERRSRKRETVSVVGWMQAAALVLVLAGIGETQANPAASNGLYRLTAQTISGFGGASSNASGYHLFASGAQAILASGPVMTHPNSPTNVHSGFLQTVDWRRYVVERTPTRNDMAAPSTSNLVMRFNLDLVEHTLSTNNLRVYSAWQGHVPAAFDYTSGSNRTVISLTPSRSFHPGEQIRVSALNTIGDIYSNAIRPEAWEFVVAAGHQGGGFSGTTIGASAIGADDILIGDWNRDGRLDAALVSAANDTIQVWTNGGGGLLHPAQSIGVNNLSCVALADVNSDGFPDLILGHGSGNQGRVLFNNVGAFADPVLRFDNRVSSTMAAGDLDGDGDVDVMVVGAPNEAVAHRLRVYVKESTNFVRNVEAFPDVTDTPKDVQLGDLDADGDLDAFVVNDVGQDRVWLNTGSGAFSSPTVNPFSSDPGGLGARLADLNGDGTLDAAVVDGSGTTIWTNNGSAMFAQAPQPFSDDTYKGRDLDLKDVNGDTHPDLIVAFERVVYVFANNGNAQFYPHAALTNAANALANAESLGAADFTGDGYLDILAGSINAQASSIYSNTPPPGVPTLHPPFGVTYTGFGVRWDAVPGAARYNVEYITNAATTVNAALFSNATSRLTTDTNVFIAPLAPGGTFHVRVRAENPGGTNLYSVPRIVKLWHPIRVIVGDGGSVTPSGEVGVYDGVGTTFVVRAASHYYIDRILTNGSDVLLPVIPTNAMTVTWTDTDGVPADKSFEARFSPAMSINGVPVDWLNGFFPTSTNLAESSQGDQDADGHLTWQEYRAGTDPTNPTSVLKVVSVSLNGKSLSWNSTSGRFYTVVGATNLTGAYWPLASNIPATPVRNSFTNAVPGGDGVRFYRVDLVWTNGL